MLIGVDAFHSCARYGLFQFASVTGSTDSKSLTVHVPTFEVARSCRLRRIALTAMYLFRGRCINADRAASF